MSNRPLVSAVIIFLNAERYIEEAIESVFAQTYTNWELLLADDGSTDGSSAIARKYATRHPEKVRYMEHPGHQNRGMSATRNLGFRNARGAYLALLDADDVWLPHKLEQQVAILNAQPTAGMVYAPTQYWYSWANSADATTPDDVPELGVAPNSLIEPPTLLLHFLQEVVKSPGTCSVLLRREVVEAVGGFEESFRGMYEDQAFFAKVCLHTSVYMIGDYSARYRQHPDSCCHVAADSGQYQAAEDRYLRWLAKYIFERKIGDNDSAAVLHKLLWPYRHPILQRALNSGRSETDRIRTMFGRLVGRELPS